MIHRFAASPIDVRRIGIFGAAGTSAMIVALALDRVALSSIGSESPIDGGWSNLFRAVGFLPPWFLLGLALALCDGAGPGTRDKRSAARRGLMLIAAPTLAFFGALTLQLVVRRQGPQHPPTNGPFSFRPILVDTFSTSGLELPSSHVAASFAGCFVLWSFFPRAWLVWLILGAGCASLRLLDRANYLSDAVLGIIVAYAAASITLRGLRDRSDITLDGASPR